MQTRIRSLANWTGLLLVTSPLLGAVQSQTVDEAVVFDLRQTRVIYEADGTSVEEHVIVAQARTEAGVKELSIIKVPYMESDQKVEVDYVRVRKANHTVIATPPTNAQDLPAEVSRSAPSFSHLREKHILVRALGAGDQLEFHISVRTLKPEFPGLHWYSYTRNDESAVKEEKLEVSVPLALGFRLQAPDWAPTKETTGDRIVYAWSRSVSAPTSKPLRPRLERPAPTVQLTTFKSWEDVGKWYEKLQAPCKQPTDRIRKKAAQLLLGIQGDEDRVRALYDFVSQQIRSVDISFGLGRFQPHSAEDVLDDGYGDGKDKHTLLTSLLEASGYKAWPVLVGLGSHPDSGLPSPGSFDHVITAVPLDKNILWLDTTSEVAPFRFLSLPVRGRAALVIPDAAPASLMQLPDKGPFANSVSYEISGSIDDQGVLRGTVDDEERGDIELATRTTFRSIPPAQWKDLLRQRLLRLGLVGEVENPRISPQNDTQHPFHITFDFQTSPYPMGQGGSLLPIPMPMPALGLVSLQLDGDGTGVPVRLGVPGETRIRYNLQLPEGWVPTPPPGATRACALADYASSATLKEGRLLLEHCLTWKAAEASPESLPELRTFREGVRQDENRVFLGGTWGPISNYELTLISTRMANPKRAEKTFRDQLAKGTARLGTKLLLGSSLLAQGQTQDALLSIQEEAEARPLAPEVHAFLAVGLFQAKRPDEAMTEAWKVLSSGPSARLLLDMVVRSIPSTLARGEALPFLRAVGEKFPEMLPVALLLARANLRAGDSPKALELLRPFTDPASTSPNLTIAAYVLADEGRELEQAKAWSTSALESAESKCAHPEQNLFTAFSQMVPLVTGWDTLGWTCFKMGDPNKALPYLEAAWAQKQEATIGAHLAEVYAALGRKQEAECAFALALACRGSNQNQIKEDFKRVLGKEGPGSGPWRDAKGHCVSDPYEELARTLTYPLLYTPKTPPGRAFFTLIIGRQGLESAMFRSGDPRLSDVEPKLRKIRFSMPFPDGGPEKIVRLAELVHYGPDAYLVLSPLY